MGRLRIVVFALCTLLPVSGHGQNAKCVDMSADPHYRLVAEAQDTRVFLLDLGRLESTGLVCHDHPYLNIVTSDSQTTTMFEQSGPILDDWYPGNTRFAYTPHAQKLRTETWITHHAVIIETNRTVEFNPLQGNYARDLFFSDPGAAKPSWTMPVSAGPWIVIKAQLARGDAADLGALDYLIVALADMELREEVPGKEPRTVKLSRHEALLLPAGSARKLRNTGSAGVTFIAVEL